jgi:hypothetical protein
MSWTTEESWFVSLQGQGIVLLLAVSRMALGPVRPPAPQIPVSLGLKTTVREGGYSCSSAAGVNEWNYTSTAPYTTIKM